MSERRNDSHDEVTVTVTPRPAMQSDTNTRTRRLPPYNVVILNDEDHTFEYVIEVLCKLFGHGTATAETLAWQIHNSGRGIVFTTHKEFAELKREMVLAYGPDPRIDNSPGSLGCYIEPAAGD